MDSVVLLRPRILACLADRQPRSVRTLAAAVQGRRSTVGKTLDELRSERLVEGTPKGFVITGAGLAHAAALEAGECVRPRVPIAALEDMPSDVHRAIAELTLGVAAVRWHELARSDHWSVVLAGEEFGLKSWLMKFVILLLGGDVDAHVLEMCAETPGAIGVRHAPGARDEAGPEASAPVIGIDEPTRSTTEVKRKIFQYLTGNVALKGRPFRATPMLALNPPFLLRATDVPDEQIPRPPLSNVRAWTGLDGPEQRRAVIANLQAVKIGDEWRSTKGKLILEHLATNCPFPDGPPRPTSLDDLPDQRLQTVLKAIAKTDRTWKRVNYCSAAYAVRGLTAYHLTEEQAFRCVVWNLAVIMETTESLVPDWRERLTALLRSESSGDGAAEADLAADAPPAYSPAEMRAIESVALRHAEIEAVIAERELSHELVIDLLSHVADDTRDMEELGRYAMSRRRGSNADARVDLARNFDLVDACTMYGLDSPDRLKTLMARLEVITGERGFRALAKAARIANDLLHEMR